jgi:trehalose monomycolate/heme transporter
VSLDPRPSGQRCSGFPRGHDRSVWERLGRWVYRRRRSVVIAAAVGVTAAALLSAGLFKDLVSGGFNNPDAESSQAAALAAERLGRDAGDALVVYRHEKLLVDDPSFRRAVTSAIGMLPPRRVESVVDYYGTGSAELVSIDRHATYVALTLRGRDDQERREALEHIEGGLRVAGLDTWIGGPVAVDRDVNQRVAADLRRAELWSAPILLTLLVLVFGGVAAACPPLVVGAVTLVGALAVLRGLTEVTEVSVYAVNVACLLGVGLAIDYGLFMVTRFREELRRTQAETSDRERAVENAVARTVASAGRTVAVSGLILTISLAGLLIFPQPFLRSLGLGGIAAGLLAVATALIMLPALLALMGSRINALPLHVPCRLRLQNSAAHGPGVEHGAWYRIATSVMRHPALYAISMGVLLITLSMPFLRVEFGSVDHRVLPVSAESRQAYEMIDRDFRIGTTQPVQVLVTFSQPVAGTVNGAALERYSDSLRRLAAVTSVRVTGTAGATARISVGHSTNASSSEARQLVQRIRDLEPPPGTQVLVGGRSAELVDLLHDLAVRLPWMALITAATTFTLLLLAFGSVVVPIKALVMNVLSLGASFGAVVWIFQDGHLSGPLGFTPTGMVDAAMPILVLAVLFGVSMDYEVFLLSRVRERYGAIGDTNTAVAAGLQQTGRIITGAALLLIVVTAAFTLSGIAVIKLIGVAMVVAIAIDATIVRIVLVPSVMCLLGTANWWMPRPLGRFLQLRHPHPVTNSGAPGAAPTRAVMPIDHPEGNGEE